MTEGTPVANSALVDLYLQIGAVAPEQRTQTARMLHEEISGLAHGAKIDDLPGIDAIRSSDVGRFTGTEMFRGTISTPSQPAYPNNVGIYIKVTSGSASADKPVCSNPNCPNR